MFCTVKVTFMLLKKLVVLPEKVVNVRKNTPLPPLNYNEQL